MFQLRYCVYKVYRSHQHDPTIGKSHVQNLPFRMTSNVMSNVGIPDDAESKVETISCISKLIVEEATQVWKIRNFDEIPFISKYPIVSRCFFLSNNNDSLWQMVMTKHTYWGHVDCAMMDNDEGNRSSSEDEDYCFDEEEEVKSKTTKPDQTEAEPVKTEKIKRFGIRLCHVDENSSWDAVKYYFTFKTSDGFTKKSAEREEPGNSEYRGKPAYTYLTESDFEGRDLFAEKYLEITCHITYSYIEGNIYESSDSSRTQQYGDDLRVLYHSKKFSDVILVTRGGKLAAHKNILYARAPGFEKLLEEDKSLHKKELLLNLDDDVAKAMVYFMYSGRIDKGFPLEKCVDLHNAAEGYGVVGLKKICSSYFKANLGADVCRTCLNFDETFEDCLEDVKRIPGSMIAKALAKVPCCHKSQK